MEKKKIVYLSADFGAGHKNTVEAIRQGIEKHHPGKFNHEIIDIAGLLGSSIDKVAEVFFKNSVLYAQPTWKAFFEITDKLGSIDSDRRFYAIIKPCLKPLAEANPDIVIACYPLMAYSVSRFLKESNINVPFISLVTDTGQVHINWVSKCVDHYLVPTADTGFYLEERGIEKKKIFVSGFPVRQNFYKNFSKEAARAKYNIPKGNNVILYFSGAWGVGKVEDKVVAMDSELNNCSILVVCGNNKKLQKRLQSRKYKNDVQPLGFIDDVAEAFAATDLVVSKAGGISTMELVTVKKPVVITEVTPGQEEPNARFVETMGFGYVERKPEELGMRVKYIFEYNDLARLKNNLNNYHLNENADKKVADFIYKLTEESVKKQELQKTGYLKRILHLR